jgi:hypothetical protein
MTIPVPMSDTQFLAHMLRKTRLGDQVTRAEDHRLEEIATFGHTKGGVPPSDVPVIFSPDQNPASATRVSGA